MPKFVQIIGPQAVGKMTVGQELAKITDYKLLYNHMTIEMVRLIFDYDKEAFRKINSIIRYEIFKEFSKSNEKGIIFTGCFDFENDFKEEKEETDKWMSLFDETYTIELETTLEERLRRNKTANRLKYKASKRDLEWSENDIYKSLKKHRLNSKKGEGEKIFKNFSPTLTSQHIVFAQTGRHTGKIERRTPRLFPLSGNRMTLKTRGKLGCTVERYAYSA